MTVVRMWEGVVRPGELAAARAWLLDEVVPSALATAGCRAAEAYVAQGAAAGSESRVVVVTRWDDAHAEDWEEGAPPRQLLRRSHAWGFRPLERAPGALTVRPRGGGDDAFVERVLTASWGGPVVLSRGLPRDAATLPGLVAQDEEGPLGLLTWTTGEDGLEVVTVDALVPRRGVGTALLRAAEEEARRQAASRLWLVVTNDDTAALRLAQRAGLRLVALAPVDADARWRHGLPAGGRGGVPVTAELELAKPL